MQKLTPKEQRDPTYCSRHREYMGTRRPRTGCQRCLEKYRLVATPAVPVAPPSALPVTRFLPGRPRNHIVLVLDDSMSMEGIRTAALAAFNATIATMKSEAAASGQETTASILLFSSGITVIQERIGIGSILQISKGEYRTKGSSTALFDAIGSGIRNLEGAPGQLDPSTSFLLIVVTDGEENSSYQYTAQDVAGMMRRLVPTDRWTFAFQLPPGRADAFSLKYGVARGNISEWEATERGVSEASQRTNSGLSSYFTARARGRSSVSNFYSPDLANVDPAALLLQTEDVTDRARVFTLDKGEEGIREFCERKTGVPFMRGAAFYQFMKDEDDVQEYKRLALRDLNSGRVLIDRDRAGIRRLLGLPGAGTISLRPGNHAGYEIFVQSTSTNRKLPRGTKVLWYLPAGSAYRSGRSSSRPARM